MIKRADIILISAVVTVAVFWLVLSFVTLKSGSKAVVSVDNKPFAEYKMDTDGEYEIKTEYGTNTLLIENGTVKIVSADCPDKYCVRHIKIESDGQMIVCLPHKLTVEIEE
jgi:hypothetical protein